MAIRITCGVGTLLICFGFSAMASAAEPEEVRGQEEAAQPEVAATVGGEKAQAYLGLGLVAASSRYSQLFVPDDEASGGGLAVHGAAHSGKVNPSLDIGFSGQVALMSREFDTSSEEVGDFLYEIDGGLRISDLFYVSLGGMSQSTAHENPDVVMTYGVIPLSAGILHTNESGYVLAQLRVGAGRLSNDQNDDTESVKYAGLRAIVQHGFGSGVQFMLGLGLDRYDLGSYQNDDFVRLEFGLGFGL